MFGTTNIAKNSDKSQWVYSGLEIAFDAKGEWNFGNESAGNVVIFSVDNSSWSNADNWKNDFLVLDEGDTFGINGNICTQESLVLTLVKQGQHFVWVCISMVIIVIDVLTEKNL